MQMGITTIWIAIIGFLFIELLVGSAGKIWLEVWFGTLSVIAFIIVSVNTILKHIDKEIKNKP